MVKFKSDNGGEYINCAFKEHLTEARIKHETSTPYYPQQNGKAKRNNEQSQKISRCKQNKVNNLITLSKLEEIHLK
jgi:transposase InsO family protein